METCGRCGKQLDVLNVRVGDPLSPTPICRACMSSLHHCVKRARRHGPRINMKRWLAREKQVYVQ